MSFGWYPREHRAALDGMLRLSLEERGAYNTLLDLMYDRGGPIPDDPRWLAGWMGVPVRRWAAIRAGLISAGKIYETDGHLMNDRAAAEIENQKKLSTKFQLSGHLGGTKRALNAAALNKNKDLAQAPPKATLKLKTQTETIEEEYKGAGAPDAGLSDRVWSAATKASRNRSGIPATRRAVAAALNKGATPEAILSSVTDHCRSAGDHAKGVHRIVEAELWRDSAPKRQAPPVTPEQERARLVHLNQTGEWRETWGERPLVEARA